MKGKVLSMDKNPMLIEALERIIKNMNAMSDERSKSKLEGMVKKNRKSKN